MFADRVGRNAPTANAMWSAAAERILTIQTKAGQTHPITNVPSVAPRIAQMK
jgi:hypothetical protein